MSTTPERRRGWIIGGAVGVVAIGVVLAPLVISPIDVPPDLNPSPPTTAAAPPPTEAIDCANKVASLRPTGPSTTDVAQGSYMANIVAQGRLRVGVSPTTLLFSSVNPLTGEFQGFDDDIAREVAAALFGDPTKIEFVAIPQTDRVPSLVEGRVDMVVSTFSITCARRQDIAFSTEYFTSGQRVLVPIEDQGKTLEMLAGEEKKVCAANGSTSLDLLHELFPPNQVEGAASHTECLSLLQQGQIDAVSTDDTILAGMVVQDPNVVISGERMTEENYGLGLPPGHDDWVRYVNGVLEDVRASGRWGQIYNDHLLGPMSSINPTTPAPPPAVYAD